MRVAHWGACRAVTGPALTTTTAGGAGCSLRKAGQRCCMHNRGPGTLLGAK